MSSSLHPYDFVERDKLTYEFTTANGIVYVAYFLDMAAYSSHFTNVYTFNFENCAGVDAPHDDRIADTICTIVGNIFDNNRNAVIIVCDNTDHREQGRNRLFQQWYARLHNTSICKVDRKYQSEDYDIYSSLLIHVDNPDLKTIIPAFIKLTENGLIPEDE